jgi:hypothetical protein
MNSLPYILKFFCFKTLLMNVAMFYNIFIHYFLYRLKQYILRLSGRSPERTNYRVKFQHSRFKLWIDFKQLQLITEQIGTFLSRFVDSIDG